MSWECPDCHRRFRQKHQSHSCYVMDIEHHFTGQKAMLLSLYEYFSDQMSLLGDVIIEPMKGSILFKKNSVFVSLRTRMDHIDLAFILSRCLEAFVSQHTSTIILSLRDIKMITIPRDTPSMNRTGKAVAGFSNKVQTQTQTQRTK